MLINAGFTVTDVATIVAKGNHISLSKKMNKLIKNKILEQK